MKGFEARVIVPLVTPFSADGSIDETGLRRCVRRLLKSGVKAIFLLGSSGEYVALDRDQRQRIMRTVVEEASGKAELAAGITDLSEGRVRRNMADADTLPIDAYVLSPPFYFRLSQDDIARFYARVSATTARSILVYNIPQVPIEPATLERIVRENPRIIGIKDSTSNMMNVHETIDRCKSARPEMLVYQGTEELIGATLLGGGDGAVPGLGNVDARPFLSLCAEYRTMSFEDLAAAQRRINELAVLYHLDGSPVAGIKRALRLLGVIENDLVSSPLKNLPESNDGVVRNLLDAGHVN